MFDTKQKSGDELAPNTRLLLRLRERGEDGWSSHVHVMDGERGKCEREREDCSLLMWPIVDVGGSLVVFIYS